MELITLTLWVINDGRYHLEISCLDWGEGLNPMMPSFKGQCRLPDWKVISQALHSLPSNGDGSRLQLTNSLSLWHFVSGVSTVCTGLWLQANEASSQPLTTLGTKAFMGRVSVSASSSLQCWATKRASMKNWFSKRFHLTDPLLAWIFKNNQC